MSELRMVGHIWLVGSFLNNNTALSLSMFCFGLTVMLIGYVIRETT